MPIMHFLNRKRMFFSIKITINDFLLHYLHKKQNINNLQNTLTINSQKENKQNIVRVKKEHIVI